MEPNKEEIIKFSEDFFKNLGGKLRWNGPILVVENIPEDFEKFFGKKAPYSLVFEKNITNEDGELMEKGSVLLKAMASYLDNRGQTTLIKIDFERDWKKEFEHYLKLKNAQVQSISKKESYVLIERFTVMTILQYLNEKEQLTNDIYLKEGKVVDFDIDKYNKSEGRKEDVPKKDVRADYAIAREALKGLLQKRINDTAEGLKKRLDREVERIKDHYKRQFLEIEDGIKRANENIVRLEKEKTKPNADIANIDSRIAKTRENLKNIETSEIMKKLRDEEAFFVNDETHRHAININNKLMNTTLIYYPVFHFTIFLKGKNCARQIEIEYNPLDDKITPVLGCEVCKRETKELALCSSGHIICTNCYSRCGSCDDGLCSLCNKRDCEFCSRKLCKKCAVKCNKCWKTFCKTHMKNDFATGKELCFNCAKRCSVCGKYSTLLNIKPRLAGVETCEACFRLGSIKKVIARD